MFKPSLRRVFLSGMALACASAFQPALAQDTPIKMLVGYPAGGSSDLIARVLAEGMQKELHRQVIVENRPGAGGQLAAQALKAAAPDGSTLFLSNSHTIAMIPLTMLKPGFDTMKDFEPVAMVAVNPDVFGISTTLVSPQVNGLRAYAQWANANAGKGNVGIPAQASAPDFAVGLVAKALGANLQSVPYRGDGPVVQDVVAGQVSAGIGSVGAMLPHARSGKLRILAVNGSKRLPLLPDVPTYAEQGVDGYEEIIFTAIFAPAGVAPDVIRNYNAVITRIVNSPAFAERLSNLGIVPTASTPAELGDRVRRTMHNWQAMVRNSGWVPK